MLHHTIEGTVLSISGTDGVSRQLGICRPSTGAARSELCVHDVLTPKRGKRMTMAFKRQTYSSQVVDFIKQCILNGVLAPGEQVKEVMLAEKLGISRAPIREALQILAQDGLITSEPQKGKYIRIMTRQEILDSYQLGGILEGAAIAYALPSMTEKHLERLKGLLQVMGEVAEKATGLLELTEVDDDFHEVLMAGTDNRHLVTMARNACATISKFLLYNHWDTLFTPREFHRRHLRIMEAVESRDPFTIEQSVRNHYHETGERMALFGVDSNN